MQTYNAIIRLGGKLENEVQKNALTTPELLILQKIHGKDAVVKIEAAGHWDEHYSKQTVKDEHNHDEEIVVEYDDATEKERLTRVYGSAICQPEETPADAISRMFGEYAPLPDEMPEFKAARKATKATGKEMSGNLKKVS